MRAMRDIRSDLQDRANLLGEQINNAQAQFEELIQQHKQEHDSRVGALKSELEAVHTLMGMEKRRLGARSAPEAPLDARQSQEPQGEPPQDLQAQLPRRPQAQQPQPREAEKPLPQRLEPNIQQPQELETKPHREEQQPRRRLAEFLVHSVREFGPKSKNELCRLAMQEGYFPDGENAEPGVHATLMHVVEAGLIRQLQDGTFAPPTLLERLRLAV